LNSIPGATLGINYTVQMQELVKLDIIVRGELYSLELSPDNSDKHDFTEQFYSAPSRVIG